jgi:hypothetical protein
MSDSVKRWTGGCLCGALRYEAEGEPQFAGLCYCADCRKASGSGFIPFLGFSSQAVRFTGSSVKFSSKAASGRVDVLCRKLRHELGIGSDPSVAA